MRAIDHLGVVENEPATNVGGGVRWLLAGPSARWLRSRETESLWLITDPIYAAPWACGSAGPRRPLGAGAWGLSDAP